MNFELRGEIGWAFQLKILKIAKELTGVGLTDAKKHL
jgi:ribosomal protein L7/L12